MKSDAHIDREVAELADFVRAEATGWYPELGKTVTSVTLVSSSVRVRSRSHRLRIHAPGGCRDVFAKVTSLDEGQAAAGAGTSRPMLGTPTDYGEKHGLEFRALALADEHIGRGDDPRLAAVRALAHIPERRTLILQHVEAPSLNALLRSQSFRRGRSRPLEAAFTHAGAWLRAYHRLRTPVAGTRRSSRAELVCDLERYGPFLEARDQDPRFVAEFVAVAKDAVAGALPEQLPVALGHGDAAMRNVLVFPEDRVAMFDMLGRWATPVYEDLAYFTLSLRLNGLQGVTYGIAFERSLLRRYEDAFLTGYFAGEVVPRPALGAFELLVLLDRWAAQADTPAPRRPLRRTTSVILAKALRAAIRREAAQILEDMHATRPS